MRTPAALPLALALLLAGCTSGDPQEPQATALGGEGAAPPALADAPVNDTPEAATAPAVAAAHAHDLWGGATRLTRIDADVTAGLLATGKVEGRFPPLDGLVLEGTGSVEVLLNAPRRSACSVLTVNDVKPCTPPADDPSPSTTLRLEHRDAAATAWSDLGVVAWGSAITIPVRVEGVDMPHSGSSLWQLRVVSDEPVDSTLSFHAKVDIVRGEGAIPLWPGHVELHGPGDEEREVLRAEGRTEDSVGTLGPGDRREEQALPVQGLVSFGTRSLIVLVNVTRVESPPGTAPTAWDLHYADATGAWGSTRAEAGEELRFVLPVAEGGMDSPYLEGSRWRLLLTGDVRVSGPRATVQTPAVQYAVEYEMVAIASSLPPEAYARDAEAA